MGCDHGAMSGKEQGQVCLLLETEQGCGRQSSYRMSPSKVVLYP